MEAGGRRSGPGSKGRFGSYRTRRFSWKRPEGEPVEPKDEDERIPDDGGDHDDGSSHRQRTAGRRTHGDGGRVPG